MHPHEHYAADLPGDWLLADSAGKTKPFSPSVEAEYHDSIKVNFTSEEVKSMEQIQLSKSGLAGTSSERIPETACFDHGEVVSFVECLQVQMLLFPTPSFRM